MLRFNKKLKGKKALNERMKYPATHVVSLIPSVFSSKMKGENTSFSESAVIYVIRLLP